MKRNRNKDCFGAINILIYIYMFRKKCINLEECIFVRYRNIFYSSIYFEKKLKSLIKICYETY